ncbi:MAG: hypothetical protein PVI90_13240 [Desulfobacteraceae bacterium]
MFVIPKGKPVLTNLNTYYLNIKNLIEHFQGELGSGGIFFSSTAGKGVLFFDEFDVVNGYIQNRDGELVGQSAIEFLLDPPAGYNYLVSIHSMEPEDVYFWTQISTAQVMYDNLSSEFTDIGALIQKLKMERLTGYIDVSIKRGGARGTLFMRNGQIVGDSLSWINIKSNMGTNAQKELISKVKAEGAVFRVFKISGKKTKSKVESPVQAESSASLDQILIMLGELLAVLEDTVSINKRYAVKFGTILKKKWVEMADQYPFLDPFAGELNYKDKKLEFYGEANSQELVAAIVRAAAEIVVALGLQRHFSERLESWKIKYNEQIRKLGINSPFS